MKNKNLKSLFVIGFVTLARLGFGMESPETTLQLVKKHVESEVEQQTGRLIPLSMKAHYFSELETHLGRGKFDHGRFSDFFGDVDGTVARGSNEYFPFHCDVSARVFVEQYRKQRSPGIVLQEDGGSYLILQQRISCVLR